MKILWIAPATKLYSDDSPSGVADFLYQSMRTAPQWCESTIVAPEGSTSAFSLITTGSKLIHQYSNENSLKTIDLDNNALNLMLHFAYSQQNAYDAIINLGHDWLAYYRIPEFSCRYVCIPNLVRTHPSIDNLIRSRAQRYTRQIAFLSKYQRSELSYLETGENIIGQPFPVNEFLTYTKKPIQRLFWSGRIFPEKGLHVALKIAMKAGLPISVSGEIISSEYFQDLKKSYSFEYLGVLKRKDFYKEMGNSMGILQVQDNFQEAFGRITVESMLSGTPVIAYNKGANTELIQDKITGFLVSDVDEAVDACKKIDQIDRWRVHQIARGQHSSEKFWQALLHFLQGQ